MIFRAIRQFRQRTRLERQMKRVAAGKAGPVIVFQMGKVASSTIEATLRTLPGIAVFRAHRLHQHGGAIPVQPNRRLFESWLIYDRLIRNRVPAKVVTMVREPIGRNISGYFQNLDLIWKRPGAHASLSMEEMIRGFFEMFDHHRGLNWFDSHFRPVLGVDVYEHPFDYAAGFQRLVHAPYDILILRMDASDEIKAREIGRLVGASQPSLVQRNVGGEKRYAAIYAAFRRAIRLPENYVNEMLTHACTRHFFSPEEIAKLRLQWLR